MVFPLLAFRGRVPVVPQAPAPEVLQMINSGNAARLTAGPAFQLGRPVAHFPVTLGVPTYWKIQLFPDGEVYSPDQYFVPGAGKRFVEQAMAEIQEHLPELLTGTTTFNRELTPMGLAYSMTTGLELFVN